MKLIDVTGQKFGRLTVIERVSPPNQRHIKWLCKCDCGTEKIINGEAMRKGNSRSCGCLRRDMGAWNKGKIGPDSHSFRGVEELPQSYFGEVKYKANKRGVTFNVTLEYLLRVFKKQRRLCAISGVPLQFQSPSGPMLEHYASLDRKDSSKGYIRGNVQWVDRKINFMKQSSSDEDFILLCRDIARYNPCPQGS